MLVYVFSPRPPMAHIHITTFFVKLMMVAIHGDRYVVIYGIHGCNQIISTLGYVARTTWQFITSIDLCQSCG